MLLKAFTFVETLIVLVITSILASVAVYKGFFSLEKANFIQIKSDVALIRSAIIKKYNKALLLGEAQNYPLQLDNALSNIHNTRLFDNILEYPVFSTSHSEKNVAKWIKESNSTYSIYVTSSENLIFSYDKTKGTFDCDFSQTLCKELYQ